MPRKLIALQVDPRCVHEIDAFVGNGLPGDAYFFATRSDFLRAAIARLIEELRLDKPVVRHRDRPVQPVAPAAGA
ncbi:hypothetical protein CCGE525_17635 [Rhizobium jaguaris]|uniref:Uncharacterized protein n=1 Tax=Rhizobium jaguaris TaxID=1312183 RepID=A0A387FSL5_9HYPH|nr:hypothetical protein CCGE525_17635 [Rhizobium jaguaris]